MVNKQNLIPMNMRSKEEAREISAKGGKASGEARRQKKAYKELLQDLFSTQVDDEQLVSLAEQYGVKNPDVKTLTLLGMINAAINGNHKAFDTLFEMSGEKQHDGHEEVLRRLDKVLGDIDVLADE